MSTLVGNVITVALNVRDTKTGQLVDPLAFDVVVIDPDGEETIYAYPSDNITRDDTGLYQLNWLGDQAGRWFWRAMATAGTGPAVGNGYEDVDPLLEQTGGPIPDITKDPIEIVIGDDYQFVDGRAFEWAAAHWPTIDGSDITVSFRRHKTDRPVIVFAGSVVNSHKVRLELTATDTRKLLPGRYSYAVKATLTDDNVATIATGDAAVTPAP